MGAEGERRGEKKTARQNVLPFSALAGLPAPLGKAGGGARAWAAVRSNQSILTYSTFSISMYSSPLGVRSKTSSPSFLPMMALAMGET